MTSPFMTSQDAAMLLLFTKANGAPDLVRLHQFLARYRLTIRTVKRGRSVLIDKASLTAHLERESVPQAGRRNRSLQSHSSRFQQRKGASHSGLIASESGSDVHARQSRKTHTALPSNSVVGGAR